MKKGAQDACEAAKGFAGFDYFDEGGWSFKEVKSLCKTIAIKKGFPFLAA